MILKLLIYNFFIIQHSLLCFFNDVDSIFKIYFSFQLQQVPWRLATTLASLLAH